MVGSYCAKDNDATQAEENKGYRKNTLSCTFFFIALRCVIAFCTYTHTHNFSYMYTESAPNSHSLWLM